MTHRQWSHVPVPLYSSPYPQPTSNITHGSTHHLRSWTFTSHALKTKFLLPITCLSADNTGFDTLSTLTCSLVPILDGRVRAQGAKPWPETFPLAMAQRRRMFRPCRSCSRWPCKMQLLTASGISHLYLERGGSAREHLEPQRAEELSRDRGAFHPWVAAQIQSWQAVADFIMPWTAAGPQRSSHRNHLRSGAAWPPATAAEPALRARWEAREEEMAANSAEQRGSPGPPPCSDMCALIPELDPAWPCFPPVPYPQGPSLSSPPPPLQAKALPSAGRCHTLMRLPPAAPGLLANQPRGAPNAAWKGTLPA